jgi:YhcH/YjgK/YiaL family protein
VILDRLEESHRYQAIHPLFARAFEFLRRENLRALATGRHDLDGDRLYVKIDDVMGRGHEGARLEAHRRYIDIQVTLEGDEAIGWRPLAACRAPGPFDSTADVGFFEDSPETWFAVHAGSFAIFFPEDAHAPLAAQGRVKKAIVKVRLE